MTYPDTRLFIAGQWQDAADGKTIAVHNPATGQEIGRVAHAGIADLDQNRIELHLDDVHVVTQGGRNPAYREEDGQRVMKQSEITVRVNLGRGQASQTVWTCDFSHDYVTINADYRS